MKDRIFLWKDNKNERGSSKKIWTVVKPLTTGTAHQFSGEHVEVPPCCSLSTSLCSSYLFNLCVIFHISLAPSVYFSETAGRHLHISLLVLNKSCDSSAVNLQMVNGMQWQFPFVVIRLLKILYMHTFTELFSKCMHYKLCLLTPRQLGKALVSSRRWMVRRLLRNLYVCLS